MPVCQPRLFTGFRCDKGIWDNRCTPNRRRAVSRVRTSRHPAEEVINTLCSFFGINACGNLVENRAPNRTRVEGICAIPREVALGQLGCVETSLVRDAISKDKSHADGSTDTVSCCLPKEWVIRSLCHVFMFSMCNLIIPRKCDISVETILPRIPAGNQASPCVKITHGLPAGCTGCTEPPYFSP